MRGKHAYVVINPRAGQDMTKLPDVIAVLAAAGWKTDNALVEYSGHGITLATRAAEEQGDLKVPQGGKKGTISARMSKKLTISESEEWSRMKYITLAEAMEQVGSGDYL